MVHVQFPVVLRYETDVSCVENALFNIPNSVIAAIHNLLMMFIMEGQASESILTISDFIINNEVSLDYNHCYHTMGMLTVSNHRVTSL